MRSKHSRWSMQRLTICCSSISCFLTSKLKKKRKPKRRRRRKRRRIRPQSKHLCPQGLPLQSARHPLPNHLPRNSSQKCSRITCKSTQKSCRRNSSSSLSSSRLSRKQTITWSPTIRIMYVRSTSSSKPSSAITWATIEKHREQLRLSSRSLSSWRDLRSTSFTCASPRLSRTSHWSCTMLRSSLVRDS